VGAEPVVGIGDEHRVADEGLVPPSPPSSEYGALTWAMQGAQNSWAERLAGISPPGGFSGR
jgi:hypothetical protein